MKKQIAICFSVLLLVLSSITAFAEITVTLDGVKIEFDVEPTIIDGRTLVPVRAIYEAMGATVDWNGEDQCVTAVKGKTIVEMIINQPTIWINHSAMQLDCAPLIIDGRTLVPVRAVSDAFDYLVEWDGDAQRVIITTKPSLAQQVLELVNQERSSRGLVPLVLDDAISETAQKHSKDMIDRNFFDHVNPDGESPFQRMQNDGISFTAAAENIAAGQGSAKEVVAAWMNSPGHKKNILGQQYRKMGLGVAYGGAYSIYWTQCFTN